MCMTDSSSLQQQWQYREGLGERNNLKSRIYRDWEGWSTLERTPALHMADPGVILGTPYDSEPGVSLSFARCGPQTRTKKSFFDLWCDYHFCVIEKLGEAGRTQRTKSFSECYFMFWMPDFVFCILYAVFGLTFEVTMWGVKRATTLKTETQNLITGSRVPSQ